MRSSLPCREEPKQLSLSLAVSTSKGGGGRREEKL